MVKKSNTDAIKIYSKAKREEAARKAQAGIERLVAQNAIITFESVVRESGVSLGFLYGYPEITEKIKLLRAEQEAEKLRKQVEERKKMGRPIGNNPPKKITITASRLMGELKEFERNYPDLNRNATVGQVLGIISSLSESVAENMQEQDSYYERLLSSGGATGVLEAVKIGEKLKEIDTRYKEFLVGANNKLDKLTEKLTNRENNSFEIEQAIANLKSKIGEEIRIDVKAYIDKKWGDLDGYALKIEEMVKQYIDEQLDERLADIDLDKTPVNKPERLNVSVNDQTIADDILTWLKLKDQTMEVEDRIIKQSGEPGRKILDAILEIWKRT